MSRLLVDIGNTRIKWVSWDGVELGGTRAISHEWDFRRGLAALVQDVTPDVREIVVANVAGSETAEALRALAHEFEWASIRFLKSEREACGVVNAYAEPEKLGVDRWAAVIGGYRRTSMAAPDVATCAVSVGTAVTLDVVRATGEHLGGLIMAGAELTANMLGRNTSDIGAVDALALPPAQGLALLGRDTQSAVAAGAWLAIAGGLDRALEEVGRALDEPCRVYLTGGGARRLRPWLESAAEIRENLIFEGMAALSVAGGSK
jgi:type III pantothenate kinase